MSLFLNWSTCDAIHPTLSNCHTNADTQASTHPWTVSFLVLFKDRIRNKTQVRLVGEQTSAFTNISINRQVAVVFIYNVNVVYLLN